jgi:hypothetical protein
MLKVRRKTPLERDRRMDWGKLPHDRCFPSAAHLADKFAFHKHRRDNAQKAICDSSRQGTTNNNTAEQQAKTLSGQPVRSTHHTPDPPARHNTRPDVSSRVRLDPKLPAPKQLSNAQSGYGSAVFAGSCLR